MIDLVLIIKTIGTLLGIIAMLGAFMFWLIKIAFKRGELYQLFKNLVEEVKYIREMVEDKFIDNDAKHRKHTEKLQVHDKRITTLEVINDVKRNT